MEGKNKIKENKKRLKINKYLFTFLSTYFTFFFNYNYPSYNSKIHEFLLNFNYIRFCFILSTVKPNIKKLFSFFFLSTS